MKPLKSSARRTFILILCVFALPLCLAWAYYHLHEHFSNRTTNYGYLISPPISLNTLKIKSLSGQIIANPLTTLRTTGDQGSALIGKWLMFTLSPGSCGQACQKTLYNMRQIRIATNADQNRVARALLSFSNANAETKMLNEKYAGTLNLQLNAQSFKSIVARSLKLNYASTEGTLYIADPFGNIILVYAPGADPEKILNDLHHLLQVSQIG